MGASTTEFLHANVFAGYGLNHIWSGHKHVRSLINHDHKVRQRWGVNRTTGSRAHDDRNLRDNSRCHGVEPKNLTVFSKGDNALLNTSTTGIQHSNKWNTGLDGKFHDLDDLVSSCFTK